MSTLEELRSPEEFKKFLYDTFTVMIKELIDLETRIVTNYHNNPTSPFDYYNLEIREITSKIICKKEVYKRLTGEDLE